MRQDMSKVLVERPRYGSRLGASYGMMKGRRKENIDAMSLEELEDLPLKDNRQRRRKYRDKAKELNENLAPLYRFLESKAGEPWDQVYSEIRENLNADSAVQLHILQHLDDFIVKVQLIGDEIWTNRGWFNKPIEESYGSFYICPKTGTLQQVSARRYQPERKKHYQKHIVLNWATQLHKIDGFWYQIDFKEYPENEILLSDVLIGYPVTRYHAASVYRYYIYAYQKHQLNKKEMKAYKVKEYEQALRDLGEEI